jgi:transcriptional regulator with XRE-family HTH domain
VKINESTKIIILNAIADKGMSMSSLAKNIGKSRSWMSKLLGSKNEITEVSNEIIDLINSALGVDLNPIHFAIGTVSATALALSALAERDPRYAQILELLLSLAAPPQSALAAALDQQQSTGSAGTVGIESKLSQV